MDYTLTPIQTKIYQSKADVVEWCGDFGVGKTFLAKVKLFTYLFENAGAVGVYVQRTLPAVNHEMYRRIDSFANMCKGHATILQSQNLIQFDNGSLLYGLPIDATDVANTFRPNIVVLDGFNIESEIISIPRACNFGDVKSFTLINRTWTGGNPSRMENKIVETTYHGESVNPYLKQS